MARKQRFKALSILDIIVPGFMKYVSKFPHPKGCWEWMGSVGSPGYGKFSVFEGTWGAHRVSYMLFKGSIPEGLHILHSCDNRKCVNPEHLSAGTPKENMHDMIRKGRYGGNRQYGRGEKSTHKKLTLEQVKFIRSTDISSRQLAKQFDVTQVTINCVRRGESW